MVERELIAIGSRGSLLIPNPDDAGDPNNPSGPFGPGGPVMASAAIARGLARQRIQRLVQLHSLAAGLEGTELAKEVRGAAGRQAALSAEDLRCPVPWPWPWPWPRPKWLDETISPADALIMAQEFLGAAAVADSPELRQELGKIGMNLAESGISQ